MACVERFLISFLALLLTASFVVGASAQITTLPDVRIRDEFKSSFSEASKNLQLCKCIKYFCGAYYAAMESNDLFEFYDDLGRYKVLEEDLSNSNIDTEVYDLVFVRLKSINAIYSIIGLARQIQTLLYEEAYPSRVERISVRTALLAAMEELESYAYSDILRQVYESNSIEDAIWDFFNETYEDFLIYFEVGN